MASFYVDLDLEGIGGAGTIGDPWRAVTFLNKMNHGQMFGVGDEILVKGKYETLSSVNFYSDGGPITVKNWLTDPWRLYCDSFSAGIYDSTIDIQNAVIKSANGLDFEYETKFFGSFIEAGSGLTTQCLNFTLKGCTWVGGLSLPAAVPAILQDCIIDGGLFFSSDVTSNNCAFTAASIPGGGSHTNSQVGWTPPTWPAWDASQSAFAEDLLYVGVFTPPQPGNAPYTGYETGLWGSARNGIGAMDFSDASATTTAAPTTTTTTTTAAPTTTTTAAPTTTTTTTTQAPAWPPTAETVREVATSDGGSGARSASYDPIPAKRVMADYHAPWWLK